LVNGGTFIMSQPFPGPPRPTVTMYGMSFSICTGSYFIPGTRTTVAFPLKVAVLPVTLRLPLSTGPSTVITVRPLKPPVSGPAMLQTKVPPSDVTANPKSEGELIVLPGIGPPMRPAPTSWADDALPHASRREIVVYEGRRRTKGNAAAGHESVS